MVFGVEEESTEVVLKSEAYNGMDHVSCAPVMKESFEVKRVR